MRFVSDHQIEGTPSFLQSRFEDLRRLVGREHDNRATDIERLGYRVGVRGGREPSG